MPTPVDPGPLSWRDYVVIVLCVMVLAFVAASLLSDSIGT